MILHMHNIWLLEVYSDASIGIINIDAHFDTRPDEPPTSGTMFREILDNDENVDYLVLETGSRW